MDKIQSGWFSEINNLWPGQCMSLKVKEILHEEKSKFQDILVFESETYGTVLVLDGVIQCTTRDEFSYQEMLALLPLNCHQNPKKVYTLANIEHERLQERAKGFMSSQMIIGGGDGGVAREVVKHPDVDTVDLCEIDERVIEVSKKYLPQMACSFSDPKLKLHVEDGFEYMKKHEGAFDVIITDSSDPVGPACSLFEKSYYELMKKALKPGGVVCSQGECIWLHMDLIKEMNDFCKLLYPSVGYSYTTIPTYPSGQIGFIVCSLNPDIEFSEPLRLFSNDEKKKMNLKYYNADIHKASFVLPEFAQKILDSS